MRKTELVKRYLDLYCPAIAGHLNLGFPQAIPAFIFTDVIIKSLINN